MKVHFLTESEQAVERQLLEKYLNLLEVEVNSSDVCMDGMKSSENRSVKILCCCLDKDTKKPEANGISLFIDYLNESMKAPTSGSKPTVVSPSMGVMCKNSYCNQIAMADEAKFYGLCYECFKKQVINIPIEDDWYILVL